MVVRLELIVFRSFACYLRKDLVPRLDRKLTYNEN